MLSCSISTPGQRGLVPTGPFNLGAPDDYRVPDQGYHRTFPDDVLVTTVTVVVEVVSPDDETYGIDWRHQRFPNRTAFNPFRSGARTVFMGAATNWVGLATCGLGDFGVALVSPRVVGT